MGALLNRQPALRALRMGFWLGWQIQSNWTDPLLFAIYTLIKPLASAAILVIMYGVVSDFAFTDPLFTYIYLGNAFYTYVGAVLGGTAWAIIDDREHYKTIRYIYTAPIPFPVFLAGRAAAMFTLSTLSILVLLAAGVLFLDVRLVWSAVNWPLFLLAWLLGLVMLVGIGWLLSGLVLVLVHHDWLIGESVAGAFFLFSGAVFPLEVLPTWLQPAGLVIPITYWLELLRRALIGKVAQTFPTLAAYSDGQLLTILTALTGLALWVGWLGYRWGEARAREKGYIDRVTNY